MSDTTVQVTNPAGQAPAGQQTAQQQAAATTDQASGSGPSLATIQAELAEARKEAAKYRTEKNAAETELNKRKEAELSDLEKANKRAKDSEDAVSQAAQELRQERALRQIEAAARKLNIVDEETAALLIKDKIEYDNDGKPTNVPKLLEELVKAKPFLVAQANGAGATGNPTNPNRSGGVPQTLDDFKGKSSDYINEHWDAYVKASQQKR